MRLDLNFNLVPYDLTFRFNREVLCSNYYYFSCISCSCYFLAFYSLWNCLWYLMIRPHQLNYWCSLFSQKQEMVTYRYLEIHLMEVYITKRTSFYVLNHNHHPSLCFELDLQRQVVHHFDYYSWKLFLVEPPWYRMVNADWS